MGITENTITLLKGNWHQQNIKTGSKTRSQIEKIGTKIGFTFPEDFVQLYTSLNGMESLYPNYFDAEEFLFYPVEQIVPLIEELPDSILPEKESVFIFADYMHKSWWYGFKVVDETNYIIGIIPEGDIFTPITADLDEFLTLYLDNFSKLYES